MKLTLRNLLADCHRLLGEEESRQLQALVQQHPYAVDLQARLQQIQLRPGAEGVEPDVDENQVANYLDNAMSRDAVRQFERQCLTAGDALLSEISNCHEILAQVLRQPIHPPRDLRDRIERLETHASNDPAGEGLLELVDDEQPSPVAATPKTAPPKAAAGIGAWTRNTLIAVAAAAATIGGWAVWSAVTDQSPQLSAGGGLGAADPADPIDDQPYPVVGVQSPVAAPPPATDPQLIESIPAENSSETQPSSAAPAQTQLADDPQADEAHVASAPMLKVPAAVAPAAVAPAAVSAPGVASAKPPPVASPVLAVTTPAVAVASEVGRLTTPRELILRSAAGEESWIRPNQDMLHLGDSVLVAPGQRPEFTLSSCGWEMTVVGRASFALHQEAETVQLAVGYGRFLLRPISRRPLTLSLDGRVAQIEGARQSCLLDVRPRLAGGENPSVESVIVATVYAGQDTIVWRDERGRTELAPQQALVARGGVAGPVGPVVPVGPGVPGVAPMQTARSESQAASAQRLAQSVQRGETLTVEALVGLSDDSAPLARRAMGMLGNYQPLLAALDTPAGERSWRDDIEFLRLAVSWHEDAASAVHRASLAEFGESDGAVFYRHLWGYDEAQYQAAAGDIIRQLQHPRLAVRILAFDTLRRYSRTTRLYRPHAPPGEQVSRVAAWQRLLREGNLRFQPPPNW